MRIDRKRLAEGIERALVVADILHDHAKACESAEMAGLANQDLLDIGERAGVIVLQIVERRAPIPRLDIVGTQLDHRIEQLGRDIRLLRIHRDYVEAWNRRATLYYLQNDYARSLADIAQVLAREPRHFGALAGLGMIMQDLGEDKRALEAFRKALAINPHLEKVPDLVKTLSDKVEGRDI